MNVFMWILSLIYLKMAVAAQFTISADKSLHRDGETVSLTCRIPSFTNVAIWSGIISGDPVSLSNCPPSGPCVPPNDAARYTYSATASSIGVTITSFNSGIDTFAWKCQYGESSAVYVIKPVVPVTNVQLTNTSDETLTSTLNIVRGGITYIRCSTAPRGSRPPATFQWYNRTVNQSPALIGNQSISSTPGSVMVPGQPASDLVISYSTLTLTGSTVYQNMSIFCEARDEMSTGNYKQSGEVQLNIVYAPLVKLSPNYSAYNVTEGTQNFVFTCNIIEANPLPQSDGYSWFHKSIVIQGQVSSLFTIPSVQKSDNGEYKCTAKNDYGSGTSNSLALNVQYPPSIQGLTSPSKVIESQPFNVTCQVSSNPPPDRIYWTPSGEGSVPSILYFSSVSRTKSGTYNCTAQNTMTPTIGVEQTGIHTSLIQVDVLYPPFISGMNSPYMVIENNSLNVTCRVNSNPPPDQIYWTPSGEDSVPSMLYFRSVSRTKSGTYNCTAQNTMAPTIGKQQTGTHTSQIEVDVLYTAKITEFVSKGNITEIMENDTFQLYCHVDSNPYSDISLIFGDVLISTTRDSLELIHNATAGCIDTGKYICRATNSIMNGVTVSAEINLKVPCHPRLDFRKNISLEYYRALNDKITLEVNIIAYPEPTNIMWYHRASETDRWDRVLNQSYSSTGLHSDISVHLGSERDFGDYLVNMSNSFGIFELIFHVITEKAMQGPPELQVGPIAGGVASGVIVVCIILVIIFMRRRNMRNKKEGTSLELEGSCQNVNKRESGLVDNLMYETSGPSISKDTTVDEYAAVVKPKIKAALMKDPCNLYAQVDKTHNKGNIGDVYQNIDPEGKHTNANHKYDNSSKGDCDENVYENPEKMPFNSTLVNKDGLLYADLMLNPPTTKNGNMVIQGIENRTEYAEIAYGKRGEPLPDSDKAKGDGSGKKKLDE